jgi:hypothetical protein
LGDRGIGQQNSGASATSAPLTLTGAIPFRMWLGASILPSFDSDVSFPSETHPLSAFPGKPSVQISTMYSSLNRNDIEFYFDFVSDLNGSARD